MRSHAHERKKREQRSLSLPHWHYLKAQHVENRGRKCPEYILIALKTTALEELCPLPINFQLQPFSYSGTGRQLVDNLVSLLCCGQHVQLLDSHSLSTYQDLSVPVKKGSFSYVKATLLFPCSFFSCYEEKSVYS